MSNQVTKSSQQKESEFGKKRHAILVYQYRNPGSKNKIKSK